MDNSFENKSEGDRPGCCGQEKREIPMTGDPYVKHSANNPDFSCLNTDQYFSTTWIMASNKDSFLSSELISES